MFANTPLVTILMLTHNRAHYIGQAISSILSQTYQNWELFIIDDGSTDSTSTIVSEFNEPRIKYIKHEDNKKLLIRREESLTYITGKYTAVLDSDDLWHHPEKLAKQVAWLEDHPDCVVVGSFVNLINEHNQTIGQVTYHTTDQTIRQNILRKNQFTHSTVLMRSSSIKASAGYRFPFDEDLDLFLQLGKLGTLANLPEILTSYRVHSASVSKVGKKSLITNVLAIIKIHKHDYPGFQQGYLKYQLYRWLLDLGLKR